jgi:hypothetical protein
MAANLGTVIGLRLGEFGRGSDIHSSFLRISRLVQKAQAMRTMDTKSLLFPLLWDINVTLILMELPTYANCHPMVVIPWLDFAASFQRCGSGSS